VGPTPGTKFHSVGMIAITVSPRRFATMKGLSGAAHTWC
jgi:hypothetical protein